MSQLKAVHTDKAPAAIGPYSQAIVAGDFVFTSGQVPFDPASGEVVGNEIKAQAKQVMENISSVLAAAGTDFTNVVKTTCFLTDMGDYAGFNEVYAQYFTNNRPARSCVAVRALPRGVLCEVEAIALIAE